jgi:outer membrane protein assembly factor BamB
MVRDHRRRRGVAIALGLLAVGAAFVVASSSLGGFEPAGDHGLAGPGAPPSPATAVPRNIGSYSTYLANVHRTNTVGSSTPVNLSAVGAPRASWNFTAGGSVYSEPIVSKDIVYFGATDGYEYAISTTTGKLVWKTFLGLDTVDTNCSSQPNGVTSTGTIAGERLIVSGGTAHTYALNVNTGKILWNVSIGGSASAGYYLWSSPLVVNNSAYIGIASRCGKPQVPGGIERISLTGGAELAYFNTSTPDPNGSSIWATPSLSANGTTIFVATGNPFKKLTADYDDSILALNASDLRVEHSWQIPASQIVEDGDFGATPTVYTLPNGSGAVAAENKNGFLYAWSEDRLSLLWSANLSDNADDHFSAAAAGGKLFVVGEAVEHNGVSFNSSLSAVNDRTGRPVWRDFFPQFVKETYDVPLYVDGLLVAAMGNTIYLVQASNGKVLSSIVPGGLVVPPISIANDELFVGSGDQLVVYPVPGFVGAPAASPRSAEPGHAPPLGGLDPSSLGPGPAARTAAMAVRAHPSRSK